MLEAHTSSEIKFQSGTDAHGSSISHKLLPKFSVNISKAAVPPGEHYHMQESLLLYFSI